jgi:exonuclease SbcC
MSKRVPVKKVNQKKQVIDDLFIENPEKEESNNKQKAKNPIIIQENKYEILERGNKQIKYIIHLADIHIRKNEREHEYRYVFNKLFEKLRELNINNDNCLIYVGGDIVHDKSMLTPFSVTLLKDFFIGLTNIATTVCIIGNHDVNLSENSLDSITPIIGKAFQTKYPVYVLPNNCVYEYNNLLLGVTNIFAHNITPLCDSVNKIKIALYHGTISGSKTDLDFEFTNATNNKLFALNDFKDYDYGLFGDIHKHQYLNKEKTFMYSGSLIQQNRSETHNNKGFILLDLEKKEPTFIPVHNKYGFIDVIINEDGTTNIDEDDILPENIDIKITSKITDRTAIDKLYEKLKNKNINIVEHSENIDYSNYKMDTKIEVNNEQIDLSNLRDNDKIIDTIIQYIPTDVSINKESYINKLKYCLTQTKHKTEFKCNNIKINYLKFNNMMIYGDNNVIDFNKLKGICGISDKIDQGKSSIIDILLLSIYGRCPRTTDIYKLIHTGKKNGNTEIEILVNGITYKIIREFKFNGGKKDLLKTTIKTSIYSNNMEVELSKIDRDLFIEKKICSYDDLLLNSIIIQNKSKSFAELSSIDKKNLICNIFGLDIFEKIRDVIVHEQNSLKKLSGIDRNNILKTFLEYGNNIETINKTIIKQKEDNETFYETKNKELNELLQNMKPIEDKLIEIKILKEQLMKNYNITDISQIDYVDNINKQEKIYQTIKNKYDDLNNKFNIMEKEKKKYKNVEKENKKFEETMKIKLDEKRNELNILFQSMKPINNKYKSYTDYMINDYEKEYNKEKQLNGMTIKKYNDELIKIIDIEIPKNKKTLEKRYNNYIETENNKKEVSNKISEIEQEQKACLFDLDKLKDYEYNEKCKYCLKNSLTIQKKYIQSKMDELIKSLEEYQDNMKEIELYLMDNHKYKTDYEEMLNNIKINDENDKLRNSLNNKLEMENIKQKTLENRYEQLKEMKENKMNIEENKKIQEKINIIQNEIKGIEQSSYELYNEYINFKEEYDGLKNNILDITNELNNSNDKLKELKEKNNKYNLNKEKIKEFNELILSEKNLINEINKNKLESEKLKNEIHKLLLLVEKNKEIFTSYLTIKKNVDDRQKEFDEYVILEKTISDNDFNDKVLTNILSQLEVIINNISSNINLDKIKFIKTEDGIDMIKENGNYLDMNGGGRGHQFNIIYRIGLNMINGNFKTNFIIIDELFDNLGNEDKKDNIKLIDSIRNMYETIIIISHDTEIKTTYDNTLKIEKINNGCKRINWT